MKTQDVGYLTLKAQAEAKVRSSGCRRSLQFGHAFRPLFAMPPGPRCCARPTTSHCSQGHGITRQQRASSAPEPTATAALRRAPRPARRKWSACSSRCT